MKRHDKKGFTLVELLIVIIILGILAAVVIPRFRSSADETREASLMSTLRTLRSAIELYRLHHDDSYPGVIDSTESWDNFVAQMTAGTDSDGNPGNDFGPYIRTAMPRNPINGLDTGIAGTIPGEPDDSTGWYYDSDTGQIRANSSGAGVTTGIDYFDM